VIIGIDLYAALQATSNTGAPWSNTALVRMLPTDNDYNVILLANLHSAATYTNDPKAEPFRPTDDGRYWITPQTAVKHLSYLVGLIEQQLPVIGIFLCIWHPEATGHTILQTNRALHNEFAEHKTKFLHTPIRIYTDKSAHLTGAIMICDAMIEWMWTNKQQTTFACHQVGVATTYFPPSFPTS